MCNCFSFFTRDLSEFKKLTDLLQKPLLASSQTDFTPELHLLCDPNLPVVLKSETDSLANLKGSWPGIRLYPQCATQTHILCAKAPTPVRILGKSQSAVRWNPGPATPETFLRRKPRSCWVALVEGHVCNWSHAVIHSLRGVAVFFNQPSKKHSIISYFILLTWRSSCVCLFSEFYPDNFE